MNLIFSQTHQYHQHVYPFQMEQDLVSGYIQEMVNEDDDNDDAGDNNYNNNRNRYRYRYWYW